MLIQPNAFTRSFDSANVFSVQTPQDQTPAQHAMCVFGLYALCYITVNYSTTKPTNATHGSSFSQFIRATIQQKRKELAGKLR